MRLLAPPLVTLGAWPRTHNINLQRAIIRRETCHLCVASSSTRPHALWRQSEPLIGRIGGNKAVWLANRGHTITDNQYNVTTGPTKSSVLLTSRSPPIVNGYQPEKRERKETRISGGLCCIWWHLAMFSHKIVCTGIQLQTTNTAWSWSSHGAFCPKSVSDSWFPLTAV